MTKKIKSEPKSKIKDILLHIKNNIQNGKIKLGTAAMALLVIFASLPAISVSASSAGGYNWDANLIISDSSAEVRAGIIGDGSITMTNDSSEDIWVSLTGSGGGGVIVTPMPEENPFFMPAGDTFTIPVNLNALDASGGSAYCTISASYYPDGHPESAQQASGTLAVWVEEREDERPASTAAPSVTPAPDRSPTIAITSPTSYVTTKPGQTVTVGIVMQNRSDKNSGNSAKNIVMSAGVFVGFKNSFMRKSPAVIQPGQRDTFYFVINPSADVKPGSYEVPYNYTYQSTDDKHLSGSGVVIVEIEETPASKPNLVIDGFNTGNQTISPGDSFEISANIINNGDGAAEAVEVTVSGFEPRTISVAGSDTAILPSLAIGESAQVSFNVAAHEDMVSGAYPVKFTVKYKSSAGEEDPFESQYYINVSSLGGASKALLTIYDMSIMEDGPFDADETITISYTFRNDGELPAKNIRVTAENEAGILVPTSANIQHVPELVETDAWQMIFTFKATEESKTQSYPIKITTEYETGRENEGSPETETLEQNVFAYIDRPDESELADTNRARLTIPQMDSPTDSFGIGESGTISFTVTNTGDKAAANIKVEATEDPNQELVPSSPSVQMINSLAPGESRNLNFSFMPTEDAKTKTYAIGFKITYENSVISTTGDRVTEEFDYYGSISVIGESDEDDGTRAELAIANFKNPEGSYDAGQTGVVTFSLVNNGTRDAKNIVITAAPDEDGVFALLSTQSIYSLEAGASKDLNFSFRPRPNADSYPVGIEFKIEYENGGEKEDGTKEIAGLSEYGEIDVRVTETYDDGTRADLTAEPTSPEGDYNVGENAVFSLALTNSGDRIAENIKITAIPPAGIVPASTSIQSMKELGIGESKTLSFSFSPDSSARSQSYPVEFKVDYENGSIDGEQNKQIISFSQYGSMNVFLTGLTGDQIAISELVSPKGSFNRGQEGTFTLTLINNGEKAVSGIKITADAPEGIVPSSASVQSIRELQPGGSQELSFSFMPDENARTQVYMVGFTVEYENGLTGTENQPGMSSFSQYGSISSSATPEDEDDGTKSIPKIMLSEYEITSSNEDNPLIVLAGQEFEIYLRVMNTHPTKTVRNIVASLTIPDTTTATSTTNNNVFTPVNSSNSFYIDEIPPGGEIEKTIRMHCLNNAAGRNYTLLTTFDYEDEDGNPHETTEEVGVTVRQVDKLEIGEIPWPTMMNQGEMYYMSFYFRNIGYVTLRNLKLSAVGDAFDVTNGTLIIGNFNMGNNEYYDGQIIANEPGEHTLQIVATYDLDTGEHVEIVEETVVTVVEAMPDDSMMMGVDGFGPGSIGGGDRMTGIDPSMMGGMDPAMIGGEASSSWYMTALNFMNRNIWPWIAVGAVLTTVIVIAVVKRVKKRRAFSLED